MTQGQNKGRASTLDRLKAHADALADKVINRVNEQVDAAASKISDQDQTIARLGETVAANKQEASTELNSLHEAIRVIAEQQAGQGKLISSQEAMIRQLLEENEQKARIIENQSTLITSLNDRQIAAEQARQQESAELKGMLSELIKVVQAGDASAAERQNALLSTLTENHTATLHHIDDRQAETIQQVDSKLSRMQKMVRDSFGVIGGKLKLVDITINRTHRLLGQFGKKQGGIFDRLADSVKAIGNYEHKMGKTTESITGRLDEAAISIEQANSHIGLFNSEAKQTSMTLKKLIESTNSSMTLLDVAVNNIRSGAERTVEATATVESTASTFRREVNRLKDDVKDTLDRTEANYTKHESGIQQLLDLMDERSNKVIQSYDRFAKEYASIVVPELKKEISGIADAMSNGNQVQMNLLKDTAKNIETGSNLTHTRFTNMADQMSSLLQQLSEVRSENGIEIGRVESMQQSVNSTGEQVRLIANMLTGLIDRMDNMTATFEHLSAEYQELRMLTEHDDAHDNNSNTRDELLGMLGEEDDLDDQQGG